MDLPTLKALIESDQTARALAEAGEGMCGQPGAYPSRLISGVKANGFLSYEEAGVPYSGSTAEQWKCRGIPAHLKGVAAKRAGSDAYPIRSVDEWRDAIANGYPCTVAIPWKPGRIYQQDGRWCLAFDAPKSKGGHQLCSLGYDGSLGRPYWFLFNSHGRTWPKGVTHSQGEPAGGVWIDERWAEWIVKNGELWAISDVPGFTADELDLRVFDGINLGQTMPANPVQSRKDQPHAIAKSTLAP